MPDKGFDVVSIGEILIDFIGCEAEVSLSDVTNFRRAAGGGPANVAVGVSKLGGRAAFIGKVGKDAFGNYLIETLGENGVNNDGVVRDDKANTTIVFVALNERAVPEYVFFRNETADTRLSPSELSSNLLENTRILHFSSVSLSTEPSRSATLEAISIARKAGAIITFDPNLRLSLWPSSEKAREEILSALELADIVKLNDEELKFLTTVTDLEQGIKTLKSIGQGLVIVTRGEKGAVLASGQKVVDVPAMPVQVVDTTGGGDSFMAGILTALSDNWDKTGLIGNLEHDLLRILGQWGNVSAAITCTKLGVIPALPKRDEVTQYLNK